MSKPQKEVPSVVEPVVESEQSTTTTTTTPALTTTKPENKAPEPEKLVKCPVPGCNEYCKPKGLHSHIRNNHPEWKAEQEEPKPQKVAPDKEDIDLKQLLPLCLLGVGIVVVLLAVYVFARKPVTPEPVQPIIMQAPTQPLPPVPALPEPKKEVFLGE